MAGNVYENVQEISPVTFCRCWNGDNETEPGNPECSCGEEVDNIMWRWETPQGTPKWVDLLQDQKQVVFHPQNSSGTAMVKGNVELQHNVQYYWEVKMLTQPYGTDIMVGLGTHNEPHILHEYKTYLGGSRDTYGMSYTGAICHNSEVKYDSPGFCKGTVIGVMVDMFHGTLEFYLNRKPQGICFTDLRCHQKLYPMLCSTAALSSMLLTYASSWTNSLLISAAKILTASPTGQRLFNNLPPGLAQTLKREFWIALQSAGKQSEGPIREKIKRRRW